LELNPNLVSLTKPTILVSVSKDHRLVHGIHHQNSLLSLETVQQF
jgi:hypothetical protein